jgi:inosine-uridine nucleoside N-ribohydrolase
MVETQGIYTRGMTLVDNRWYRDLLRESEEPNVEVVTAMDNDRFRALVLETLIG